MKNNQQNDWHEGLSLSMAILFVIILFGCSHNAAAQTPWTTAPNGNDIYKTTTTGNVGHRNGEPGFFVRSPKK